MQSWKNIESDVLDNIKAYLIKEYSDEILLRYQSRIAAVVYNYTAHLPKHVLSSEFDDLSNIAKIEFVETIKSWDPRQKSDIWSLAYSRITGAMKDHLRYLTKADPGRLYDWITNAAYVYMTANRQDNTQNRIENHVQLADALKSLSFIEQKVINQRYKNDMTFKEIGNQINLSESQVTRIYKQAIEKIKKSIGDID